MINKQIVTSIILAGGFGERFGIDYPKQFVNLAGKPIICHTIEAFIKNPHIDYVIIVVNKNYLNLMREMILDYDYDNIFVVVGDETRQGSSYKGIIACPPSTTHVLIHDAVRPFVDDDIINRCIISFEKYDAIDVCIDSTDTIVEVDCSSDIVGIPERSKLKRGQTPQAFRHDIIKKAHESAVDKGITNSTDDCSLVMNSGISKVHSIKGSERNIKITTQIDLHIAEKIIQLRSKNIRLMSLADISEEINKKVIIVFGGNSGIGKSICEIGKKCGALMEPLSRLDGVDIRRPKDIKNAYEKIMSKHGRIDVVIISSALMHYGPLLETTDSDIVNQISTNLTGSILAAKHSLEYLVKSCGKLVFFASSSYTRGRGGYATYSSTKAGIVNFMQALSEELCGIVDVIAINPQRTNTPLRKNCFGEEEISTLLKSEFVAQYALSAIASNITGCVIDVTMVNQLSQNMRE